MSESDDELYLLVDDEESQPMRGRKVKVVPSQKGPNLHRLIDPMMAEGPAYEVRGVEPVPNSRPKRSHVDLVKLPLHLQ